MDKTKRLAFGGLIVALSVVSMLVSGIVPFAEYTCPAIAGILLITIVIDFNKKTALIAYAAIAILSLIVVPNKEAAILFVVFLGYYPIVKSLLEQIKSRIAEWFFKLVLFNATMILSYVVMIQLFNMQVFSEQLGEAYKYGILILLLLGNVAFVLYDIALTGVISMYINKIKPRLRLFK